MGWNFQTVSPSKPLLKSRLSLVFVTVTESWLTHNPTQALWGADHEGGSPALWSLIPRLMPEAVPTTLQPKTYRDLHPHQRSRLVSFPLPENPFQPRQRPGGKMWNEKYMRDTDQIHSWERTEKFSVPDKTDLPRGWWLEGCGTEIAKWCSTNMFCLPTYQSVTCNIFFQCSYRWWYKSQISNVSWKTGRSGSVGPSPSLGWHWVAGPLWWTILVCLRLHHAFMSPHPNLRFTHYHCWHGTIRHWARDLALKVHESSL
jgi:hypothetical protein